MRVLSYQNKRKLRIILITLLAIFLLFFAIFLCRFIYLQQYIVYGKDGATLDYDQSLSDTPDLPTPDWAQKPVAILTQEPVAQVTSLAELPMQTLRGSYITTQMLLDMDKVSDALAAQETPLETLMLDLKSIYGNFYYSSGTAGAITSSADIHAVDALITQLSAEKDLYLIARISSLSDTNFALANQSCGLPLRSGALWMSDAGCYWLDPMKEDVQDYLVSIANELAMMGFDEIVFDDFRIPDSQYIVYNSELTREEAAAEAASAIRKKLEDIPIRVCFNSSDPNVAMHSDRVYLVSNDGSSVADLVEKVSDCVDDPASEIVFLTPSRDTRFDGYGILRPLYEERQQ